MAFNFHTEFDRSWQAVLAAIGVEAMYTPLSGPAIPVGVVFLQATQLQPSGDMQTWGLGNTVEYSLTDISREVSVGESFSIDGVAHRVRSLEKNDGFSVRVVVS